METETKPPQEARVTDRVLQALSTLAALLDRSIKEVHSLEADFQKRVDQAVSETRETVQSEAAHHLEKELTAMRSKLEEQFRNRITELSTEWEAERERLTAELARGTQTAAQWEAERARLNGELERLARVQAATQMEAEKAFAAVKAATASRQASPANNDVLSKEIGKVEDLVREISNLIDDPNTELSTVIRKNVERAELQSYLRGIRFALNGGGSK